MTEPKQAFDWQAVLTDTYHEMTRQIIDHIPQLLGALLLLLVGWYIAWLLRLLAYKVTHWLESLLLKTIQSHGFQQSQMRSYTRLIGNIIFWSVLLFFIAASIKVLGWKIFSITISTLLTYLPNIFIGLFIILAGFILSSVIRSFIADTAKSAGFAQAGLLARISQVIVVLTATLIGVEQLGINVAFLTTTLIVLAGVLLSGAALAFGLGAKHFVANVIGVQTVRKHYQLGQLILIDDIEGYVLEITTTMMVLDTKQGKAVIPAKLFHEQAGHIVTETPDNKKSMISDFFKK